MTDVWFCSPCVLRTQVWFHMDALACHPLPPERSLKPRGPWPCRAPDIRISMCAGCACPRLSLHVHWALSSHLTLVQSLSSGLCIIYIPVIQQMIWTQQKIQPRLEESRRRNNLASFHNSPLLGFNLWWSSSCFTHFIQRFLSCSFSTTSVLTAENHSFQTVPFASLPSWLLTFSVPGNSIFFFLLSLLISLLLG